MSIRQGNKILAGNIDTTNLVHKGDIETITGSKTFTGSVALNGISTSITQPNNDDSTKIATTEFVHNLVSSSTSGVADVKVNDVSVVTDGVANISLADVATSGSYNDLDDQPTIPVVPTKVSVFDNDAGYQTSNNVNTIMNNKLQVVDILPESPDPNTFYFIKEN